MSEFDDWYLKEKYLGFDHIDHARAAYNKGQQSQQAKIDELEFKLDFTNKNFDNSCKTIAIHQKFLDDADGANEILTKKIDELQGRVGEARSHVDHIYNMLGDDPDLAKPLDEMVRILKGKEDE